MDAQIKEFCRKLLAALGATPEELLALETMSQDDAIAAIKQKIATGIAARDLMSIQEGINKQTGVSYEQFHKYNGSIGATVDDLIQRGIRAGKLLEDERDLAKGICAKHGQKVLAVFLDRRALITARNRHGYASSPSGLQDKINEQLGLKTEVFLKYYPGNDHQA